MPTTPRGYRYPGSPDSEPPNGPLQIANLASDVDADVTNLAAQIAGRQRFWTFGRPGSDSDGFASGASYVVLNSGTGVIADAPPGDYAITSRLVISNTSAIAGFQRCYANGVSISSTDPRADTIVATARHVFVQSGGYTHVGGNLTVRQYYRATGGSPTVWSLGTEATVCYLGPRI